MFEDKDGQRKYAKGFLLLFIFKGNFAKCNFKNYNVPWNNFENTLADGLV